MNTARCHTTFLSSTLAARIEMPYFRRRSNFSTVEKNEHPKIDLSFNDTKIAYQSKTTWQLLRALLVFTICSNNFIVNNNKVLMKWSRKVLGRNLFRKFQLATFYGHFVAGEDQETIKPIVSNNRLHGVKSILDYSVEKDVDESEEKEMVKESMEEILEDASLASEASGPFQTSAKFATQSSKYIESARTYYYQGEKQCDHHMEIFKSSIDAVANSTNAEGLAAIKLTALGRPQLLLHLSEFLVQMRNMYNLLHGDVPTSNSLGRIDRAHFRSRLEALGLRIDQDTETEWFTMLDVTDDGHIDLLDWHNLLDMNFNLAKAFRIRDLKTNEERQLIPILSEEGIRELHSMLWRVNSIALHAKKANVRIMIDAEQSYLQPAIRRITMEMMRVYNKTTPMVFNTYQCYLTDTLDHLLIDLSLAKRENFCFGAKLVRGAYMEQERARAAELNYKDPICENYEATTVMYNNVLDKIFEAIKHRPIGSIAIMVASHNEDTVRHTLLLMRQNNIMPLDRVICFAQLLGMCDHVSFSLGEAGYSVYKYLPYGPVDEVLPYLSRRALENRGVLKKVQREKSLMYEEVRRRLRNN